MIEIWGILHEHGKKEELSHMDLQGWFALFVGEQEIYLCKDDSISWISR